MTRDPAQLAISKERPTTPSGRTLTPNRRVLSNGVTLVEVCQPHLHRGSISVYFRAGSRYEAKESNGISHFLEHMIFRGTKRHPSTYDLNLAVERLGGTLFAATSPMTTEFELTLPVENLEAGAHLLATILTEPIFGNIDIERRIIAEEILEDYDDEGNPIDIDFLSRVRLWPDHPLGQSVTGPLDNVLGFKRSDIEEHFHGVPALGSVLGGETEQQDGTPAANRAAGGHYVLQILTAQHITAHEQVVASVARQGDDCWVLEE